MGLMHRLYHFDAANQDLLDLAHALEREQVVQAGTDRARRIPGREGTLVRDVSWESKIQQHAPPARLC
jgi:hypothetical protein